MNSEKLLAHLKTNPFVLAPMAGITDSPFRSFMRAQGAGIVISELVSCHGIQYQSGRTLELMAYGEEQRPVGIQLFGGEPDIMAKAAFFAQESGADFIDINLGCPVPKVVKKNAGSALLKDPIYLEKYLTEIKRAIDIPLTIKIRTGWDSTCVNAVDVVNAAEQAGVTWVAIHGRTRAQGYSGQADWGYIADVKSRVKLPIIGNGDVVTPQQAVDKIGESGCDGVMIGRGCLKNPWIFKEAQTLWERAPHKKFTNYEEVRQFFTENIPDYQPERRFHRSIPLLFEYLSRRSDERYVHLQMRKFAAWFSSGYPYSKEFRSRLFQTVSAENILVEVLAYFDRVSEHIQADTSEEAFLMGGHG